MTNAGIEGKQGQKLDQWNKDLCEVPTGPVTKWNPHNVHTNNNPGLKEHCDKTWTKHVQRERQRLDKQCKVPGWHKTVDKVGCGLLGAGVGFFSGLGVGPIGGSMIGLGTKEVCNQIMGEKTKYNEKKCVDDNLPKRKQLQDLKPWEKLKIQAEKIVNTSNQELELKRLLEKPKSAPRNDKRPVTAPKPMSDQPKLMSDAPKPISDQPKQSVDPSNTTSK